MSALESSAAILRGAIEAHSPHFIVSMVSGGRDSACSHAVALELGVKIDLVIHGYTRTGIPQTTAFVKDQYGSGGPELIIADAGTNYEDYVLRNGFFGVGRGPHNFAYHVLKHRPFRAAISANLRKRRRGVRILLIGGVRKYESANRMKLPAMRADPEQAGNVWVNICHEWSAEERDAYLKSRGVSINPVAVQLCRSGECMCGTMQDARDRAEASALYPEWGQWLDRLETEVRAKHGFGWGEKYPTKRAANQPDLFEPMCVGCDRRAA